MDARATADAAAAHPADSRIGLLPMGRRRCCRLSVASWAGRLVPTHPATRPSAAGASSNCIGAGSASAGPAGAVRYPRAQVLDLGTRPHSRLEAAFARGLDPAAAAGFFDRRRRWVATAASDRQAQPASRSPLPSVSKDGDGGGGDSNSEAITRIRAGMDTGTSRGSGKRASKRSSAVGRAPRRGSDGGGNSSGTDDGGDGSEKATAAPAPRTAAAAAAASEPVCSPSAAAAAAAAMVTAMALRDEGTTASARASTDADAGDGAAAAASTANMAAGTSTGAAASGRRRGGRRPRDVSAAGGEGLRASSASDDADQPQQGSRRGPSGGEDSRISSGGEDSRISSGGEDSRISSGGEVEDDGASGRPSRCPGTADSGLSSPANGDGAAGAAAAGPSRRRCRGPRAATTAASAEPQLLDRGQKQKRHDVVASAAPVVVGASEAEPEQSWVEAGQGADGAWASTSIPQPEPAPEPGPWTSGWRGSSKPLGSTEEARVDAATGNGAGPGAGRGEPAAQQGASRGPDGAREGAADAVAPRRGQGRVLTGVRTVISRLSGRRGAPASASAAAAIASGVGHDDASGAMSAVQSAVPAAAPSAAATRAATPAAVAAAGPKPSSLPSPTLPRPPSLASTAPAGAAALTAAASEARAKATAAAARGPSSPEIPAGGQSAESAGRRRRILTKELEARLATLFDEELAAPIAAALSPTPASPALLAHAPKSGTSGAATPARQDEAGAGAAPVAKVANSATAGGGDGRDARQAGVGDAQSGLHGGVQGPYGNDVAEYDAFAGINELMDFGEDYAAAAACGVAPAAPAAVVPGGGLGPHAHSLPLQEHHHHHHDHHHHDLAFGSVCLDEGDWSSGGSSRSGDEDDGRGARDHGPSPRGPGPSGGATPPAQPTASPTLSTLRGTTQVYDTSRASAGDGGSRVASIDVARLSALGSPGAAPTVTAVPVAVRPSQPAAAVFSDGSGAGAAAATADRPLPYMQDASNEDDLFGFDFSYVAPVAVAAPLQLLAAAGMPQARPPTRGQGAWVQEPRHLPRSGPLQGQQRRNQPQPHRSTDHKALESTGDGEAGGAVPAAVEAVGSGRATVATMAQAAQASGAVVKFRKVKRRSSGVAEVGASVNGGSGDGCGDDLSASSTASGATTQAVEPVAGVAAPAPAAQYTGVPAPASADAGVQNGVGHSTGGSGGAWSGHSTGGSGGAWSGHSSAGGGKAHAVAFRRVVRNGSSEPAGRDAASSGSSSSSDGGIPMGSGQDRRGDVRTASNAAGKGCSASSALLEELLAPLQVSAKARYGGVSSQRDSRSGSSASGSMALAGAIEAGAMAPYDTTPPGLAPPLVRGWVKASAGSDAGGGSGRGGYLDSLPYDGPTAQGSKRFPPPGGWKPRGTPETTLFVKGLDPRAGEERLREALLQLFSTAGRIIQVRLPMDRRTGLKGIAFIVFESADHKARAAALDGSELLGRVIRVDTQVGLPT